MYAMACILNPACGCYFLDDPRDTFILPTQLHAAHKPMPECQMFS